MNWRHVWAVTPHLTHSPSALQWRHNGRDGVSNNQPHDCLLNGLFRRRSNKISKLRVTGLCAVNSPGTGEFPMATNAENVPIWWRHHGVSITTYGLSAIFKTDFVKNQKTFILHSRVSFGLVCSEQLSDSRIIKHKIVSTLSFTFEFCRPPWVVPSLLQHLVPNLHPGKWYPKMQPTRYSEMRKWKQLYWSSVPLQWRSMGVMASQTTSFSTIYFNGLFRLPTTNTSTTGDRS